MSFLRCCPSGEFVLLGHVAFPPPAILISVATVMGPLVTTAGPQLAGEGQCFNATCQFSRTVRGAEVPPELATVSQTAVFVYFFEDSTCQPVDHDRKL